MLDLTELFVYVDDVCQVCEALAEQDQAAMLKPLDVKTKPRKRKGRLATSEIATIVIAFHQSSYRTFKAFYLKHVIPLWKPYFPGLVSYNRFVEIKSKAIFPLLFFLSRLLGKCTGISFVDAMPLAACHNRRIRSHKVFKDVAKRGVTSMGWFYGFKLHIVINECGELLAWTVTPGNVDDRKPVRMLSKNIFGKLYGDKGYISQELFKDLFERGIELVTKVKKNMKNKLVSEFDKYILRKRAIIESVNDQLQNISQIEHTRHRCMENFMVNILGALIAYCLQPKKPSIQNEVYPTKQVLMVA